MDWHLLDSGETPWRVFDTSDLVRKILWARVRNGDTEEIHHIGAAATMRSTTFHARGSTTTAIRAAREELATKLAEYGVSLP